MTIIIILLALLVGMVLLSLLTSGLNAISILLLMIAQSVKKTEKKDVVQKLETKEPGIVKTPISDIPLTFKSGCLATIIILVFSGVVMWAAIYFSNPLK